MGEVKRWNIAGMIGIMTFIIGVIGCSGQAEAKQSSCLASSELEVSTDENETGKVYGINDSSYPIKNMSYENSENTEDSKQNSIDDEQDTNIPNEISNNDPSTKIPKLKAMVAPIDNEVADFYRFYYVDNAGNLNVFFWECTPDLALHYKSVHLYQEQKNGLMKSKRIIWNKAAEKKMNLHVTFVQEISIMAQWMDEKTGDFYFIVSIWGSEGKDYPSYVIGIHSNGKLFVRSQVEHHLIMDKIDSNAYATGYHINYIGQKNGNAYFNYSDISRKAVLYYSMKQHQFIKQIFTDNKVLGIIDNQFVSIDHNIMQISNIPDGKKVKLSNGNSILTEKSIISQSYLLPNYRGINISGEYVYLLTDTQYQRMHPLEDSWEMLADVSDITRLVNDNLSLCELLPKDNDEFSILWYNDCGVGFYIEKYQVK